jgi:hypothetical protein
MNKGWIRQWLHCNKPPRFCGNYCSTAVTVLQGLQSGIAGGKLCHNRIHFSVCVRARLLDDDDDDGGAGDMPISFFPADFSMNFSDE